jgi:hypothetical protein
MSYRAPYASGEGSAVCVGSGFHVSRRCSNGIFQYSGHEYFQRFSTTRRDNGASGLEKSLTAALPGSAETFETRPQPIRGSHCVRPPRIPASAHPNRRALAAYSPGFYSSLPSKIALGQPIG